MFFLLEIKTEDVEEEVKEETDPSTEEDTKKKHLEKKRKLKELFDAEYDEGESTYFDDLKGEMQKQAQVSGSSCVPPPRAAAPACSAPSQWLSVKVHVGMVLMVSVRNSESFHRDSGIG